MSEQEILILLNALDNASKTIADASSNVKASLGQVEGAAAQVEKTQQRTDTSSRALALGFNNIATSAFSLYDAYDRVQDMQVSVDRANLQVKSTLNSVEDAQRRYNEAVNKYGEDSDKAKAAATDTMRSNDSSHRISSLSPRLSVCLFSISLRTISFFPHVPWLKYRCSSSGSDTRCRLPHHKHGRRGLNNQIILLLFTSHAALFQRLFRGFR